MTSTLWAHLLNKDTTASGLGLKTGLAAVEPTGSAPADRAGTSVRILLHDTQATIEKFSERVDKLVSEAEDSRQKLLARNDEVNDEVQRLVRRVIQEQGTFLLLKLYRRPFYC
jgi:flagellar biosynthesis/type III secretory pathway protein FliH